MISIVCTATRSMGRSSRGLILMVGSRRTLAGLSGSCRMDIGSRLYFTYDEDDVMSRGRIGRRHSVAVSRAHGSASVRHLESRKSQYFKDLEGPGLTEEDVENQPVTDYLLNGPAVPGLTLL